MTLLTRALLFVLACLLPSSAFAQADNSPIASWPVTVYKAGMPTPFTTFRIDRGAVQCGQPKPNGTLATIASGITGGVVNPRQIAFVEPVVSSGGQVQPRNVGPTGLLLYCVWVEGPIGVGPLSDLPSGLTGEAYELTLQATTINGATSFPSVRVYFRRMPTETWDPNVPIPLDVTLAP
jgi:hypothetical protein